MSDGPRLRFYSHACISVETRHSLLLCDPWFFGDVFNGSWSLLAPPEWKRLDFSKLSHIWVSHEHPDHLHFGTLKALREQAGRPLKFLYRRQLNSNVKRAVAELGYQVQELEGGREAVLDDDLRITSFPSGSDTALVIRSGGRTILNQNDCQLGRAAVRKIKRRFPHIDLWLFQFSLAGYYANRENAEGLRRAKARHLELVRIYYSAFRPKRFVPFASFVKFSKRSNEYLNRYRVTPEEVLETFPTIPTQVLWEGDGVSWEKDPFERNQLNLSRWRSEYLSSVSIKPTVPAEEAALLRAGEAFARRSSRWAPKWLLPGTTRFLLTDIGRRAVLSLREGTFRLERADGGRRVAARLPSEEFLYFLEYPWGADTLNITGAFEVERGFDWRWVTYTKHCQYLYEPSRSWLPKLMPLAGALARSCQAALGGRLG